MTIIEYIKKNLFIMFFLIINQNKYITKVIFVAYKLCFFNTFYNQNIVYLFTYFSSLIAIYLINSITVNLS